MKIDKPLLHKIAHLARLEVKEHDEAPLLADLNKIVHWIEKLKEVDTTGVRPLAIMSSAQHVSQEDIPQAPLAHDKGLVNAPRKDSNYFRVPQVKD
ncbi:MAG: Asp-tRNA(Asn)/Glu-tRNA(Gln) amidotransferase subunit GatC [Bacteroidota bacterium]